MIRLAIFFLAPALIAGATRAQSTNSFVAPRNTGNPADFGRHLQRTMTLLASSTPEKRHTVRILFYGQSITIQDWWKEVAADLRRRFTNANLVIENRGLGGFAAQLLVKTAETDLYPFYPDLMIFYVYGSHLEYENIIRRARERTTAEILIQTDHVTRDEDLTEETNPAKLTPKQWTPWMNHVFLPETARKYGCGVVEQHELWKEYLRDFKLPARNLLTDGVHLNAHGNFVMAELVKPHLVHRADLPPVSDPWNTDTVRTWRVGEDLAWRDGKLTLAFDGNRVDVILRDSPTNAPAVPVRIDGMRPSEIPELYGFTRTTPFPQSDWPCLLRVTSRAPLQVEEWTITVTNATDDLKRFEFSLAGSRTGSDGTGRFQTNSPAKFVSNSKRIIIDPGDWNFDYALRTFKRPLPPGFQIKWKVVPHFANEVVAVPVRNPAIETVVTVAQGLRPGRHTLEITGGERAPIAALRVYRPPLTPGL